MSKRVPRLFRNVNTVCYKGDKKRVQHEYSGRSLKTDNNNIYNKRIALIFTLYVREIDTLYINYVLFIINTIVRVQNYRKTKKKKPVYRAL